MLNGELTGLEALIRIRHPEEGFLSAAEFIEIAEQAGLVTEIDAWVLLEATRRHSEWRRRGVDVFERIEHTLHRFGLGAEAIQVELTETAAVPGRDTSLDVLRRLRAAGISRDSGIFDHYSMPNSGAYLSGNRTGRISRLRKICFVTPVATRRPSHDMSYSKVTNRRLASAIEA